MHRFVFVVIVCFVLVLSETVLGPGAQWRGAGAGVGSPAESSALRANVPTQYRGLVRRCELALGDVAMVNIERCVNGHIAAHRAVQRYPARFTRQMVMCRGRLSGHGPKDVQACVIKWSGERAYAFAPASYGSLKFPVL